MTVRCALFLDDDAGTDLMMHGYDDPYVGMIALLVHLRTLFRGQGQDLLLVPLDDDE